MQTPTIIRLLIFANYCVVFDMSLQPITLSSGQFVIKELNHLGLFSKCCSTLTRRKKIVILSFAMFALSHCPPPEQFEASFTVGALPP